MKKWFFITAVALVLCFNLNLNASVFIDDEGVPVAPTMGSAQGLVRPASFGLPPVGSFTVGQEGVRISSLCASYSTNTALSRINAMMGLAGVSVPNNRAEDPAAWWVVPSDGLQSFDYLSTSFDSWMGTTVTDLKEKGHRIVIHAAGGYPVSDYQCRITCTDTNLFQEVAFGVWTNSSGAELTFSSTFVGIDRGLNEKLDSYPNPTTGLWVQAGDDTIFTNGQKPSEVVYDWWYRFGATVALSASSPAGFGTVNGQFASSSQSLTAELLKAGTIVSTRKVTAALPRLIMSQDTAKNNRLRVQGGQLRIPYTVLCRDLVGEGGWVTYYGPVYAGQEIPVLNDKVQRYFTLRAGM